MGYGFVDGSHLAVAIEHHPTVDCHGWCTDVTMDLGRCVNLDSLFSFHATVNLATNDGHAYLNIGFNLSVFTNDQRPLCTNQFALDAPIDTDRLFEG